MSETPPYVVVQPAPNQTIQEAVDRYLADLGKRDTSDGPR